MIFAVAWALRAGSELQVVRYLLGNVEGRRTYEGLSVQRRGERFQFYRRGVAAHQQVELVYMHGREEAPTRTSN